jgi:hypothetical protein
VMRALRGFGQADFRDDAQSSLPLELALAEHVLGPAAPQASAPETPEPEAPPRSRFAGPQPSGGRPPFRPAGSTFGPEDRGRAPGPAASRTSAATHRPSGASPLGADRPGPAMPQPAPPRSRCGLASGGGDYGRGAGCRTVKRLPRRWKDGRRLRRGRSKATTS